MRSRFLHFFAILAFSASLLSAASITGTVTNKTTGKPSAGDPVTLLSMASGMEEAGSAKTDSKGHYTLDAKGTGPFMVRVDHEKSPYYKNLSPGETTADVAVYDVAAKVEGVSTEADVMRVEARNGQLNVNEVYFVRNNSQPARTEQSDRTYEFYVPAEAVIDSSAATGPSGMSVAASPVAAGEKGHYAFAFPIRPNEGENGTRYEIAWHVSYKGSYKFTPKLRQGAENVAVMMPHSMIFKAGPSTGYQPSQDVDGAATYLARNVSASQPLEFTVSGTGALPHPSAADQQQGGMGGGGEAAGANAPVDNRPGGGLGAPIDTPDPLHKYKWWIMGVLAVILAVIAGFMLRKPANQGVEISNDKVQAEPGTGHNLIASLKDELFNLETEKIQGKVTEAEYANHKAAIEVLMKRALR